MNFEYLDNIDMSNTLKINLINKVNHLRDIVKNVIRKNQLYKTTGFLEINDLNSCVIFAENIYKKLKIVLDTIINENDTQEIVANETDIIDTIQSIIEEISTLISLYGCDTLDNLINICIGNKYIIDETYREKYKLLNNYFSPTRYKILNWKKGDNYKNNEEKIIKTADNFECFDIDSSHINFQNRIYGVKVAIHHMEKQHTIIVYGIMEDILLELIDDKIICERFYNLNEDKPVEHPYYSEKSYQRFINCLTLKDLLINTDVILKDKYIAFVEDFINNINKKSLLQIINDFIDQEIMDKRNLLITLLVNSGENESHYLAYLLYDLLSNDIHGLIDTYEQTTIYDSLPFNIKKYFREAMKHIITYTNKLSKIDNTKISLEQRICLMKTDDVVKEKAMVKLKEVKLKAEDTGSGSKAMQFLEGLLKIPFGIYKEEQILRVMPEIISSFNELIKNINKSSFHVRSHIEIPFPYKMTYTSLEIYKYLALLNNNYKPALQTFLLNEFKNEVATMNRTTAVNSYVKLFTILYTYIEPSPKINYKGKTVKELRTEICNCIDQLINYNKFIEFINVEEILNFDKKLLSIENKINTINVFMQSVTETLDRSVYGHLKAKRQIERIIGQWINGDLTGYCFGFEGPPGVGKTSLAKNGIANCLRDDSGTARPFAFIAMGGSTNSSTLDGHNYTYVGSSWGRIVDILMDTKILNPIIFIDELDKVSKTENGKEIIGILMHLIDQTQNDTFQDKYFNGININLSKALFIFSYNDAELIDRILLDRIHRIKFEHLCNEDKLVISRNFILPELYKKMGLVDMIEINDDVIEYIIENYTAEPGVRKLKELMFEIVGEINLALLKNTQMNTADMTIPIVVTREDIKNKYLKERREIKLMKIHPKSIVGVINGLWANSVGKGGVLPIEASFFPTTTFLDLKLTGMQGDVMKESMTVAKSLAWTLFVRDAEQSSKLQSELDKSKNQGLHIHVPEGATPKDGPSAGTAITMVIYSLFTGRKIKNDIAITGEICLQGRVTAIGGLDLKILGGINAGVKTFIYPAENKKDFDEFMEKYSTKSFVKDINFISVETIDEVIPLIF
jgi:ATP-dependent Lon protease